MSYENGERFFLILHETQEIKSTQFYRILMHKMTYFFLLFLFEIRTIFHAEWTIISTEEINFLINDKW